MTQYIAEPFKIKTVEPIKMTTREERVEKLRDANYNLFGLNSEDVYIDFLTDSGTGALSDSQWAGMMRGDESYAGARGFRNVKAAVNDIFHYDFVQPVHQGRAAEQVLFPCLLTAGKKCISNMHFDTTRGHVDLLGAKPVDIVVAEAKDTRTFSPFKGNMDTGRMEEYINEVGADSVGLIIMTITNNSAGGQPVSMENMRTTSEIAKKYNIPVVIDAARYAENAHFIKIREEGYADKSIIDITREMFGYADAFTMSAKKDAIVNMGGLIGVKNNKELYEKVRGLTIPYEGFVTYGGLAGRDLEALAIGLYEGTESDYLRYRIGQIQYLGGLLQKKDIPFQYPVGGHAVFLDAKEFLPHIPYTEFPGHTLACELYIEAGIRSCDIGSYMMGNDPETGIQIQSEMEFTRLAIPRRVYTQSHFDVVALALENIKKRAHDIKGYKITWEPPVLRHFTAKLEPLK